MRRGDLSCYGDIGYACGMLENTSWFHRAKRSTFTDYIATVAPSLGCGSVPEDHHEESLVTKFHELILLNSFTRKEGPED